MKRLQVGMIGGGGAESFFGGAHKRAISLDATREFTAGALRSDPEAALTAAEEMDVQGFRDYNEMADACRTGELSLDYVTIVTPNHAHYEPAKTFLETGVPVLCEKPVTLTVEQAEDLTRIADKKGLPFILAHTYTGHPMLMYARELVKNGTLGNIRKIQSWYTQGFLADKLEEQGVKQAEWRTQPQYAGMSCCGGDIGTHAFVGATWTTGLNVKRVSARLNSFVAGRQLDDDFNVIAEMDNGATALIIATQIAIGYKNDHGIRVCGDKGSLEWHQERAESLLLRRGEVDETYWLGANYSFFPDTVSSYLRGLPSGHNQDFYAALANLHTTMERKVRQYQGESDVPAPYPHPDAHTGVAGLKFVSAAVESSHKDGDWVYVT